MTYDATYERLDQAAIFDLKGPQDVLQDWCSSALVRFPDAPNTVAKDGSRHLAHIAPCHWLLWDHLAQEQGLSKALRPDAAPSDISIVRLSDAYARFHVTGTEADQIMSIACPLDLHSSVFPQNACSFSEVFTLKGLVWRRPGGFGFKVERSFADMVEDYLDRSLGHV